MSDDSDLFNRIADSNVERVQRVANVLGRPPSQRLGVIGGRPDGTMVSTPPDLEKLLQQIMTNDETLRTEIEVLKDQLTTEREARERLQNIIRQVADLIVNGSRGDA